MLTIYSGGKSRDCSGMSRRNFLKVGSLGLAGLTLADLLAAKSFAGGVAGRPYLRDKSVVFLYLNGGPSQLETFDPKPDAPVEVRNLGECIQTKLPGVLFGGAFPKLAARADKLAVVRSFKTGSGNHDGGARLFSGDAALKTPLGSLYARIAGAGNPANGMPNNVFVTRDSVGVEEGTSGNFGGITTSGTLPSMYAPFHPKVESEGGRGGAREGGKGEDSLLSNMQLRLPNDRLDDRRLLLNQLDDLRRFNDAQVSDLDRFQQQAYEVLVKGVSAAFDLKHEDPRTIERYDTAHMPTPAGLAKRLPQTASHSPVGLGKQFLLARRLVEAGCGFVSIGMTGWDMHGNNGFGIQDGFDVLGPAVDHAVSAFLDDLEERGLSDKVLLVMAGEMGRTPKLSTRTAQVDKTLTRVGRDHWANLASLLLAGGGLTMGQVVGQSDRTASVPTTEPYTPMNLLGTIAHTLFDLGQLRLETGMPVDILRLFAGAAPIRELVV